MKKTQLTSITFTLTLFFALINPQLSTATVLLDFENLPTAHLFSGGNQNIGNFYPGLTFGPDVTGLVRGDFFYNDFAFPPHSGNNVVFTDDPLGEIEITFNTPVLDVGAFYTSLTAFELQAYDPLGTLIGSVSKPANTDGVFFGFSDPISISATNIKSVKFIGAANFYVLDDLSYTVPSLPPQPPPPTKIPEPSSLFIMVIGIFGCLSVCMDNWRQSKSL